MPNTLFLWLEGPMQSWGERARWSVRDSAPEPTKSGVVGLLACALGLKQDGDLRSISQQLQLGVRCDWPGTLLVDYHTIQGPWGTQLSDRTYLCDAVFLVAIQSDNSVLISQLANATQNPVWPIFLGRKSCPPSRPLFDSVGDFDDMLTALESLPTTGERNTDTAQLRAVIECSPNEGSRRRDEIDSRSQRTFMPRYSRDVLLTVRCQPEEAS